MVVSRQDATARDLLPLLQPVEIIVEPKKSSHKRFIFGFALGSCAALLLTISFERNSLTKDVEDRPASVTRVPGRCTPQCDARARQRNDQWGGDLLDVQYLLRSAQEARENQVAGLKEVYGEKYYSDIFEVSDGKSRATNVFVSANLTKGISSKRFKRKVMMKVLKVQTTILNQDKDIDGCDCSSTSNELLNTPPNVQTSNVTTLYDLPSLPSHYARMVWSTGGHSAAAGHGNLFNESYTAFMERGAKGVFAAVGIDLEGRNYGMGSTSSGPEVALCSEAIFGSDSDIISWDFGMTDGLDTWKTLLYANRAGLNPNRPAIVGINIEGLRGGLTHIMLVAERGEDKFNEGEARQKGKRVQDLQVAEEQGLTSLIMVSSEIKEMTDALPDMYGMTSEQMNEIPEYSRHFKCQGFVEKGEPYCTTEKFSRVHCNDRVGMDNHHPGWKLHALYGNIMALFLSDVLIEAIEELQERLLSVHPAELLSELKQVEDADYAQFFQSSPPEFPTPVAEGLEHALNSSLLYRGQAICHTALLPSQARYLGIVTESDIVGPDTYDLGTPLSQVASLLEGNNVSATPLVYDERFQQSCPVKLQIDSKDFFYTMQNFGWTSLTIPNDAERRVYGRDSWNPHGVVVVCFAKCTTRKCSPADMRQEAIQESTLKIELNSVPVTKLASLSNECSVLGGEHGYRWPADTRGQYLLRTKIDVIGGYTRISSIIVL